jgi:hypothetical protein
MRRIVGWSWVGLVLGLAACGGRYDIGSGSAGSAGSDVGSGGTELGSGGSAAESGGAAVGSGGSNVGSGGTQPGSGGSAVAAGGTGTGGSASGEGGSAAAACVYPVPGPEGFAEPAVVWRRISRFLYGEQREPLAALPESTTPEWISAQVDAVVRQSQAAGEPPAGLVRFVHAWGFSSLQGAEARAREWTLDNMMAPVAGFFSVSDSNPANENHSLLIEPSFLQNYPTISTRGALIANQFLCAAMSPIEDSELLPAQPGETSRQTLARTTSGPVCAGCHGYIDPFGFALSHYDAAGEYREDENGLPIDATGDSIFGEFDGAVEMSLQLANSEDVRHCLAGQLLNFAVLQARGVQLPAVHLPIETNVPIELEYIVCESGQHSDSFLRMIQAVVMVPSFSMVGPDM